MVKDTGIGVREEQRQRLFEMFSQADMSTTRQHGGMGIGLAICKRICDAMGGNITLMPGNDSGSEFHVELPVERAAEPGVVWLVTTDNLATILVRTVADKSGRKLRIVATASQVIAADGDTVLLDLGSVAERPRKGWRVIALNAEPDVTLDLGFEEVIFAPLKPADVRRVLEEM